MSQITIFFVCAAVGIASGIIYDALYILRTIICGSAPLGALARITVIACDIIYFVCLAAAFLACAYFLDFYEIRLYMLAACMGGALLYIKSMHVTVAIFINKVYNKHNKIKKSKEISTCRTKRKTE